MIWHFICAREFNSIYWQIELHNDTENKSQSVALSTFKELISRGQGVKPFSSWDLLEIQWLDKIHLADPQQLGPQLVACKSKAWLYISHTYRINYLWLKWLSPYNLGFLGWCWVCVQHFL